MVTETVLVSEKSRFIDTLSMIENLQIENLDKHLLEKQRPQIKKKKKKI